MTAIVRRAHYGTDPEAVSGKLTLKDGVLSGTIDGVAIDLAHIDMVWQGSSRYEQSSDFLIGGLVPVGQPLVPKDLGQMKE